MKHIKDLLAMRQASLQMQKGAGEWSTFNVIRDDRVSMFDVKQPQRLAPKRGRVDMPIERPNFFPRPAHSN